MVSLEDMIVLEITRANISVIDKEFGTVKDINKDDLLNLLSICNEGQKIRSGRLPKNILEVAIEEPGKIRKVLLFWKKSLFDFKTDKYIYENVEFPALLFMFKVVDKLIEETYIYALKGVDNARDVTDSTILYQYPFTHVHDNGRVCWGSNRLPEITSLHQLSGLPFLFINSSNKIGELMGNYDSNKPLEEILNLLTTKKIGIDDILLSSRHLTYGAFCTTHLGSLE